MGLNQFWVPVVMVILLARWRCDGCWENERKALLELKDYLNYPDGNAMSSWERTPNCCYWEYVECNPITKRITSLYPWRDGTLGDWYLNTSVFLPFEELNDLSLQGINIMGCVQNEGFERLRRLGNLEHLDLSDNKFNNSILPSLSRLSSLKSLTLDNNKLEGIVNLQELNNLTSLKELALQGNQIEGFKSSDVEELLRLSNLEFLDLSNNYLNRSMLSSLKGLSTLKSLNLGYNPLEGIFSLKELDALRDLEELNLSGSKIIKFEASRDTKGLSKLRKLNLDNSTTNGRSSSLQSLGAFPYLRILSIKDSEFKGKIFGEDSQDLTNLEEVFLDGSSLNYDSLQSLEALPSLKLLSLCSLSNTLTSQGLLNSKTLEHLYLNFSSVDNVWQIVSNMTSLKSLSLYACGLSGTIPVTQGLCELKHLQVLDIHFNDFNGTLPLCLANLTSLQDLDLSENHFTGKIFPLQDLTSIQNLILSDNYFQIPISLGPLFNHSQLKYLDAENNEVYAEVEVQNLMPKFQLETLILSGPGYAGSFPKFLYYQHNLQEVQLSHIKFEGEFPCWLLENNTKLEKLYLSNNSLSGVLRLPVSSHIGLSSLDISNNGFHGQIPEGIGSSLPRLWFLKMSENAFSGSIPSSFGNISFLQALQLDGNQFTQNIPDSLSNCSFLEMLDVSDNHLSGKIPPGMGSMASLKVLDLSRNNLSGSLPSNFNPLQLVHIYLSENRIEGSILDAFYNCSQLITLDLSHNFLTGRIPEWIGSLPFLGYLSLSYNNLEGEIPKEICNLELLKLIDLSNNNISGHIPPCLRCTGGSGVIDPGTRNDQQPFGFTTKSYTYSYGQNILILFSGIDLSHNKLTGEIPPEFGDLMTMKVLNLSHNSLTGLIPSTFSNLSEIESLDLSYNNLVGEIPPHLTQLSSLAVFSVAHNNLSGKTPERVAQFGTFEKSSYEGNPFLCGLPLPKSFTAAIVPSSLPRISTDTSKGSGFIEMGVFYVSFLVSYIVVLLAIAAVLCINPYWRQRWFNFIEVCIRNCQYFLEDNVYVLFKFKVL